MEFDGTPLSFKTKFSYYLKLLTVSDYAGYISSLVSSSLIFTISKVR